MILLASYDGSTYYKQFVLQDQGHNIQHNTGRLLLLVTPTTVFVIRKQANHAWITRIFLSVAKVQWF